MIPPSAWVQVYLDQIPRSGRVLDLACGQGRHARLLAERGLEVLAVDRDPEALAAMAGLPGITTCCLDLEGLEWPLAGASFAGIVVTNYLWRPHLDALPGCLQAGGVLIYETFMQGNARFGKPSNPDFLLQPGELQRLAARHGLEVLAFAEGEVDSPRPAVIQRVVARRPAAT
ncbi:MAG TPA: class I SAM-dependent methyltransferase [Rhodocyclaceae bacterium]|nr:class I SAM-dependent methyltransferase [Rhodocyclaceae bacterium]